MYTCKYYIRRLYPVQVQLLIVHAAAVPAVRITCTCIGLYCTCERMRFGFWLVSPFALLSICGNTQSHTVQYVISVSVCFLPSNATSSPSLLLLEPLYSVHVVCAWFDHICDFQLKKQLCQISPVVMTPIHYLQVYRIMSLCPIDDPSDS